MEFKGTKGSFELVKIEQQDFKILCIGSDSDNTVIAHVYFQGEITEKELANALLLSKSKVMLNTIKKLEKYFETPTEQIADDTHLKTHYFHKLKKLIKEATEL